MQFSQSDTVAPCGAEESLAGQLLIAMPSLAESEFDRSVIYLCAHSADGGAMGIVINRRLSQPGFDDLLQQLDIAPTPPRRRIGLCAGGPVEAGRGLVLHSTDWGGDGTLTVNNEISLSANLEVLKDIAAGEGPKDALLALGHAGWEAGQLEEEIARHSAWLVAPASREIVFGSDHAVKWRKALAAINIDPLRLASFTGSA
ncbi:YqgE/AlgH family protein [Acetobacter sp.]|jgi:putative transcriptional regulator|uniref:YqgE/AlgH family protein n=1 Tax=Acetobacter sp. TaxID=440 RepID=UPI0025BD4246|nr:YqgE/AlgH family protein [Acetobacter sp.]MCH4091639.1 YqgE/AlgH family protein [Acetobacter sp.]MCI1300943.1 YqgE/AlgH family protein [Acetobacter sp.]MCI1316180.1 YqgE/AlgH family protein [Acetobacter sp.]